MSSKSFKIQTQRERAPGYWESTGGYYSFPDALEWCETIGFGIARIIRLDDQGDWDEETVEVVAVYHKGKMFFPAGTGVPTYDGTETPLPMDET